jgi:hypothetical protein
MKRIFLFISISIIILSGCHHVDKKFKENIRTGDSVAINYFAADGRVDTVIAVKIIHDRDTMARLANFITNKLVDIKTNCGYDGSIHFFKNDTVVQGINFRMNDENCMQFSFVEDGRLTATFLSAAAKKLLESVQK